MSETPDNLWFTSDHLWVTSVGFALLRAGITDFAQDSLGDVVAVTPPEVGSVVTAGGPCGEIESTKSISELVSPVTGTVTQTNGVVVDAPDIVNSDPYGEGWLFEVTVAPGTTVSQLERLMDASAYQRLIGE
jgi:glycine cleavage system H protein